MAIRDDLNESSESSGTPPSPGFHPRTRYISSQYLADSSLSTDVSLYDFTLPHHITGGGGGASSTGSNDGESGSVSSFTVYSDSM